MSSVQSVISCRLTFDKLLRAELRGGLRAKLPRGGAVRAAGQVTAGQGGLRAKMWQNLRCGLTAGQVTAGRGGLRTRRLSICGAGCGLNCNLRDGLRAQICSPRRALIICRM